MNKRKYFIYFFLTSLFLLSFGCKNRINPLVQRHTIPTPQQGLTANYNETNDSKVEDLANSKEWSPISELPPKRDSFEAIPDRRWKPVYFAYDSNNIGTSEREKLEILATYMEKNNFLHVVIEGHCDKRGSEAYNIGLSERRALACKKYLSDLGIPASKISTVGYGEEKLADPADNEKAHAKNRRAEFVIGTKK
ncbi:MAG: OmpA family protein [Verrucomicrobiota bacterium]|nr:OmpA family protein [Verrucomicrobiota bacterium]